MGLLSPVEGLTKMRSDIEKKRPGLQIGYHHFAFFRGHLNGLTLETLGDRYLETGTDLRQARRTLDWIRSELVAAAKRYQHQRISGASMARLLRIEPEQLKIEDAGAAQGDTPTLEDFQALCDPQGFYSERELIEEFERRYAGHISGTASKQAERNERLLRKLLDTVTALEAWIAAMPRPSDPISIWIEPVIADRLLAVDIVTIEDLVTLINRRGHFWYRKVPSFGVVRAKRIMKWLEINRVVPVAQWALVPPRELGATSSAHLVPAFGIVPIERLQLPADLDGLTGTNRPAKAQIQAANDREAIAAWEDLKGGNEHTRRAYRAQAERFVLWLVNEKRRPLSSATPEDCAEYVAFLTALDTPGCEWPWRQPRSAWIGEKGVKRTHPDWKPFSGSMNAGSRRHAVLILKGLFAFLVKVRYLDYDPWTEVRTPKRSGLRLKVDNVLNERQWTAVVDELEEMPRGEPYLRLRLLLWLGYGTGLRLDELLRLTVKELVRLPDGSWELDFIGKGDKQRQVPLDAAIFGFLCDYMEARGHGRNAAEWTSALPLLTSLRSQSAQKVRDLPLSSRTLDQILKTHFDAAAERLEDLFDQAGLRAASAHWLRHTFSTELISKGASVRVVQDLLGHEDPATTAIYTHVGRKARGAAVATLAIGVRR